MSRTGPLAPYLFSTACERFGLVVYHNLGLHRVVTGVMVLIAWQHWQNDGMDGQVSKYVLSLSLFLSQYEY